MKILLDTHLALWAVADSNKISKEILDKIASMENEVYYSLASVWEVAIKHFKHPEQISMNEREFVDYCDDAGFAQLPITSEAIFYLRMLRREQDAPSHNDPFDRIIISQAKVNGMKLFTHDSLLWGYSEDCIIHV